MVNIKPFKGLRYNIDKVKDFKLVIMPPYDVVSEEEKKEYLNSSPFNLLKITLNKDYREAASIFDEWLSENVFVQDEELSIYIYSEEFLLDGKRIERIGFIALAELEDVGMGNILPHEKTMYAPKLDRLNLLRYTRANFGQIFFIYEDNEKIIDHLLEKKMKEKPEIDFEDKSGTRHRLWKVDDEEITGRIEEVMKEKKVVIADGHHRYKAAFAFRHENPHLEGTKYVMATFINKQEGLVILPINRLIFNVKADVNELLKKVEEFFTVKKEDEKSMIRDLQKNKEKNAFGMYARENNSYYLLTLKEDKLEKVKEICGFQYSLDVALLHKLILERVLKISSEDLSKQTKLKYVKGSEEETLKELKNKKYQFGFFLNPTKLSQVIELTNRNELLPQKSTFFYPKLFSGLVIYKME